MKHLLFSLEKAVACSARMGQSKICILIDYEGFKLKHSPPLSATKFTLHVLQNHYPERLHRAYVCNPPFVFRAFWTVAYPLVDPVTKKKICFCTNKSAFANLVEDMGGPEKASSHLEECAGGSKPVKEFDSAEYLSLPFDVTFGETEP